MERFDTLPALFLVTLSLAGLAAPVAAESPWSALDSFRKTGYTKGDFQNKTQDTGNYEHKIEIYRLDALDEDPAYDWYRVDMFITSTITNYRNGDSICGWYTEWVRAGFALSMNGGEIVELGPETTTTNGTTFINMGSSLSASGPTIQAGYQYSQVIPDEGIRLMRDAPNETAYWIANLRGCSGNRGASGVSKSTYTLKPSVIVRLPQGARLRFKTRTKDAVNSFKHEKDKLQLSANPLNTKEKEHFFVEEFSYVVSCGASNCTATLQ